MGHIIFGMICMVIGAFAGVAIAYTIMETKYDKIVEGVESNCLKTIRENYAKEQTKRKLLLQELGEALDVDVVALPSFGYVTLKRAFEVPEDVVEVRGDDFVEV